MAIYSRHTQNFDSFFRAAEREYGKRLECVVDTNVEDSPARIEWLKEQGINFYYVKHYAFFFETDADGLRYYLAWSHLDPVFE